VRRVAFSNDGKTVLTASNDKSARLWDLNANLLQVFNGHTDNILSIAFSPDGKTILTGAADRTARVWDLNGNTLLVLRGHGGDVNSVVFDPDGVSALTFCADGVARKWDISQGKFKDLTGIKSTVTGVQFSPDGKSIMTVTGTPDPSLKIWDTDGNYRQTFRFLVNTAAFSPDGNNILIGGLGAQLLSPEGKILKTFIGHIMDVTSVAFSPDGKTILTGGADKTARIWDLSGKIKIILTGHSDAVTATAFSPDNKTILTGSYDKTARLWDIDGNLLRVFNGHTDAINSACFSPDGKNVLTASDDNTARLWDLTGNCVQVLSGHTGWVVSAAFSPDGERIITGSTDNTARVWDLEGNTIQVIRGFNKSVTSVAFSPDGKKVLIGSEDNIARLVELKKPVGVFLNEGLSEKISTEQAVKYGILQPDQLESENDMSKLFGGIIFCLSEAKTQINKKEAYLNTASVLLRKTAKSISDGYRKSFISCGMELYKQRPQKFITDKVKEANKNSLTSSAVVDLRNSYQFYADKCSSLDPVSISMNLPEVMIQIAERLSAADTAARKNISFDMAALSWSLLQNRKYRTAMNAIEIAFKTDSTNQFAIMTLPLVLVLNDHYIEARDAYLKYYKSYAFNPTYGSYKMIYLKDIDELERRGITHDDFEKVKELLKK
jgi:WD40 repeat protein